ncbi:MAG: divalent-cation tolerance protein CutA [Candidatus Omnitrophica bacterium]|nr:divalent-cation tolerance protein CutA [Candidatus Omnitrophota bacterium]
MKRYLVLFTTFPERKTGQKICKTLINENLTACCQIVDGIISFYWWKNKIEKSKECLCILKTEKTMLSKLKKRIKDLHPYEIPEIVVVEAEDIDKDYAHWITSVIRK